MTFWARKSLISTGFMVSGVTPFVLPSNTTAGLHTSFPPRLLGLAAEGEQVGEQAEASRHSGGELAEEGEGGVDVRPLADRRHQQAALERLAGRVGEGEERLVGGIPGVGEVEAALLH